MVGLKGINKVTEGTKQVCALRKAREKFEDPHKWRMLNKKILLTLIRPLIFECVSNNHT